MYGRVTLSRGRRIDLSGVSHRTSVLASLDVMRAITQPARPTVSTGWYAMSSPGNIEEEGEPMTLKVSRRPWLRPHLIASSAGANQSRE